MCLSIPSKIIKLNQPKTDNFAIVKNNHGNLKIDISLIKNPKINDWVLVHANLAIKKISKKESKEINNLFNP